MQMQVEQEQQQKTEFSLMTYPKHLILGIRGSFCRWLAILEDATNYTESCLTG